VSGPARTSWRLHGLLLGLMLLQIGIWALRHRSIQEYTESGLDAAPLERLDGAHVMLNRGATPGESLGPDYVASLLNEEPDAWVRTLAFSSDVCKLTAPDQQLAAVVDGIERGLPAALIDFILQCRKVGGVSVGSSSAMRRCELDWYFEARSISAWPPGRADEIRTDLAPWLDAIRAYLRER